MSEDKNKRKRVAGYGRVSTDSKDQKNSYEHQKGSYEREYKNNPKYIYNEKYLYFDRGISGTKLSRPEFDKMLFDAGLDIVEVRNNDNDSRKKFLRYVTVPSSSRKPCFDLIIVRNTSRFARNINAMDILQQLILVKVYVYFCDIDKTTEDPRDIEAIQSHLMAAEQESRMKSRMVAFGTKESAIDGNVKVSKEIYGYNIVRGECSTDTRLEIIESEAEVIRQIYKWYLQGYGIRRILRLLSENKIYTRKKKEFTQNTLRHILTNEKYKGWNVRNKYDMGTVFNKNTYAKIRDKSEWIVHSDEETKKKIPPIVSEEDFDKVQELLENKREHKLNKGKYSGISEFASKIICGKCGATYYANRDRTRRFYNCKAKKLYTIKRCDNRNVKLEEINERISIENYRKDMYEANVYCRQILAILEYKLMTSFDTSANEKVNELEEELKQVEAKKKRIVDVYTAGDIKDDDYAERIKPVNAKIEQLNLEICQLSKNNDEIRNDLDDIIKTGTELNTDFDIYTKQNLKEFSKLNTRNDIVRDIKRMTVQVNGDLDVEYHTFDKYFNLIKRHSNLLKAYMPDDNYNEEIKITRAGLEKLKQEIMEKLGQKDRKVGSV